VNDIGFSRAVIDDLAPLDGLTTACHYRFTAGSFVK
jgi:hypothetical protein